ncbi:MAG: c-type cytochrome, partial [Polyangiaceae bacterium]
MPCRVALVVPLALALSACHSSPSSSSLDPSQQVAAGKMIFLERCGLCHSSGIDSRRGPGLGGVVGRQAGSLRGFAFTPALKASKLTWDRATLDSFLMMPAVKVPGTTMAVAVTGASDRAALITYLATLPAAAAPATSASSAYTSSTAFGDYKKDAPGVRHKITVADLPPPFASPSSANRPSVVARPAGANPQVPPGFSAHLFATDLENPRQIRVAPNGDIFVAETAAGQIRILRAKDGATEAETRSVFAKGLDQPFGIAFYPPGPAPKYVYIANTNSVVRFVYQAGDLVARGAP